MNLHAIVSPYVAAVNPFIAASVMTSTGYTTSSDGTRVPTYSTTPDVLVQVQALTAGDLKQLDSLNIQNVTRKAWINGSVQGANRVTGQGGDLLVFNGQTFLVTLVFETWDSDGPWCSVGLTQQNGS